MSSKFERLLADTLSAEQPRRVGSFSWGGGADLQGGPIFFYMVPLYKV